MISFNLNYSPKAQSSNIVTKNIQFSSVTQSLPSLYEPKDCSTPGFPVHHQLLEFGQTHDRGVSDAIQSSHPHPFFCLQSCPVSGPFPVSQFFASGDQSIGASASTLVLPMNISGLISFRIDWLDLLAVQGTLKSLFQFESTSSSVLSFLYSPTLTSIHDFLKTHNFD